jgi:hypothetical protein
VDKEGTCAGGTSGAARAGAAALGDYPLRGCILQGGCAEGRDTNDDV